MNQDSQNFIPIPPDLNAWLKLMFQGLSANVNCHTIGTIDSFDAATQTATIAINYIRVFKNANPNLPNPAADNQTSNVYTTYPLLIQCPVVILQGGGSYLTFPIKKGDTCLVLFNDREITTWLTTGQITYPQNQRTHDLSDGIALVGIRSIVSGVPIANYNTDIITLVDKTGERTNQSGFGQPYFGTSLPSGWLWCDGSSYSKEAYPLLFAAIGYTYGGSGDTFKVPQMAGQVPVGIGGPLGLTLGQETGEVTHTLTVPEIPAHTHTIGDGLSLQGGSNTACFHQGSSVYSTGSTGGGGGHNNVQPSLGVNWIIKI